MKAHTKRLMEIFEVSTNWTVIVDPKYCEERQIGGCATYDQRIILSEHPSKSKEAEEVLWHEVTHAMQNYFCYKNAFKSLGFKPNYEGHLDWLLDKPLYEDRFKSYDIEREARYVQYSKKNQLILLECIETLYRKEGDKAAFMKLFYSEIEYQKPKFTWKHLTAVAGYIYVTGYMLLIASSSPNLSTKVDSGLPECTYSQLNAGDCVSEDNPWDY